VKPAINKGQNVMCTVPINGQDTLQPGVVVDRAGKGAIVRMYNGKKKFFYAKDLAVEEAGAVVNGGKVTPPKHLEPKPTTPVKVRQLREQTLGGLLAETRKEAGLSQSEFGGILEIASSLVGDYERDRSRPTDDELIRFSELFDVDLGLLIARVETSAAPLVTETPPAEPPSNDGWDDDCDEPSAAVVTPLRPVAARPIPIGAPAPPVSASAVAKVPEPLAKAPEGTMDPDSQPSAPLGALGDFSDFIERLSDVSPLPLDRDKRRRWVGIARSLFDLGDKQ
jgi:transcriptional regulator with XRE-family HTH domain